MLVFTDVQVKYEVYSRIIHNTMLSHLFAMTHLFATLKIGPDQPFFMGPSSQKKNPI